MGLFKPFVETCKAENDRLAELLSQWRAAANLAAVPELPLRPPPARLFDLAERLIALKGVLPDIEKPFEPRHAVPVAAAPEADPDVAGAPAPSDAPPAPAAPAAPPAPPATAADHPGEAARKRINDRLSLLGIRIVAIHGAMLELVSDMVVESQLSRTLLLPQDSYEVSGVSFMGAMALANLSYACHHRGGSPGPIELPLKVATLHAAECVNGDLLFWDLAARSVAAARKDPAWGPDAVALLDRWFPAFMSRSTLAKLDLAFEFPPEVMQLAEYRNWPGLRALVADPGARSLRARTLGRLAQRCAQNPPAGSVVAGRWLEAMFALDGLELPATLLAARFFWEILESRPDVLNEMVWKGRAIQAAQVAAARIENWRSAPTPAQEPLASDHRYLQDVATCLDEFPLYRSLCDMGRLGAASSAAPITLSEES